MSKDFRKVYDNFLKYEKDSSQSEDTTQYKGLLSPKTLGKKKKSGGNEQMDAVLRYVKEIRKYRNSNG